MKINENRLLETFFKYVKIDSESCFEKEICDVLENELKELGLRVFKDDVGKKIGSNGNNIYAFLDGDENYEPILLACHLDTVTPGKNVIPYLDDDGYIKSKTNTVLGSDDKAGVSAIIESLKIIKEQNIKHRPLELVFTVREETGLVGSKNLDYTKFNSKIAFALDASGDVGTVITKAPGQYKLEFLVIGKKAHAGVEPEKGISAIQISAKAISKMKLLRIDEETTCNIGSFISEYANNVVPEKAIVKAEVRSSKLSKLEKQTNDMIDCFKKANEEFSGTLEVTKELVYKSFSIENEHRIVEYIKKACDKIEVELKLTSTGGGSDANVFNEKGITSVILGTGMEKVHTTLEQIKKDNLYNTAKLILALLNI